MIVDESHELRTTATAPDSRHTEAVSATCKRSRRAILLSGTPSLSRPFDLFRQVCVLLTCRMLLCSALQHRGIKLDCQGLHNTPVDKPPSPRSAGATGSPVSETRTKTNGRSKDTWLPTQLIACLQFCCSEKALSLQQQSHIIHVLQVDALRPGLVGRTREAFSLRYCNRRLVPVGKAEEKRVKYINNGLSHARELHELLKQVRNAACISCLSRLAPSSKCCMHRTQSRSRQNYGSTNQG